MMRLTTLILTLAFSFGLSFRATSATGAGSLDPTFGNGGKVETNFGHNIRPQSAALQTDGKLVVVGALDNFQVASQVFAVVRYLSNGALDSGFGQGGVATTAFTNFINSAKAVAIQADGKIVVAGEMQSSNGSVDQFALARFNTNGTLDSGFGAGGKITTDFLGLSSGGFHQSANVLLLQPDGKILAGGAARAGYRNPEQTALARYNYDGSLDTKFGNNGKVLTVGIGGVTGLGLLSDGQILALNNRGGIEQFHADGTAASVTGGPIVADAHNWNAAFEPDGRFVLVTTVRGPGGFYDLDVKVLRFDAHGASDPTFNNPAFDFDLTGPASNIGQAVAVAPDGRILAAGTAPIQGGGNDFGLARINSDGSLDGTFGSGGKTTTRFEGSDQIFAVVMQPDGKIVAVGQAFNGSTYQANLAMARYLAQ